jgi:hypothetical protein
MPERHDHDKNLIGTVQIGLFAKSFILRVYDVLARHTGLAADDSPLILRDVGSQEIYALDLQLR